MSIDSPNEIYSYLIKPGTLFLPGNMASGQFYYSLLFLGFASVTTDCRHVAGRLFIVPGVACLFFTWPFFPLVLRNAGQVLDKYFFPLKR